MNHYDVLMEIADRECWQHEDIIDALCSFIDEQTKASPRKLQKFLEEIVADCRRGEEIEVTSPDDWHDCVGSCD